MPVFTRKGSRLFITCITGPAHVLLGLSFLREPIEPVLIRQPYPNRCDHGKLDVARIREAVLSGVAEAKSDLYPSEIIYTEGDSPSYDIYQHCAFLLTQRSALGGKFEED
jgi:hypothetical protein